MVDASTRPEASWSGRHRRLLDETNTEVGVAWRFTGCTVALHYSPLGA
jgi:hypothetical protein